MRILDLIIRTVSAWWTARPAPKSCPVCGGQCRPVEIKVTE